MWINDGTQQAFYLFMFFEDTIWLIRFNLMKPMCYTVFSPELLKLHLFTNVHLLWPWYCHKLSIIQHLTCTYTFVTVCVRFCWATVRHSIHCLCSLNNQESDWDGDLWVRHLGNCWLAPTDWSCTPQPCAASQSQPEERGLCWWGIETGQRGSGKYLRCPPDWTETNKQCGAKSLHVDQRPRDKRGSVFKQAILVSFGAFIVF